MPTYPNLGALEEFLARPNPHDIIDAAHARRVELHGMRTSFVAGAVFDASSVGRPWCPYTGEMALQGGFASDGPAHSDLATHHRLLVDDTPTLEQLDLAWGESWTENSAGDIPTTFELGTSSDWIEALAGQDVRDQLGEWNRRGLALISDGVRPAVHPAFGADSAEAWSQFWLAAGGAGMRGHATVLYGETIDLDKVFDQLDAITAVQRECGVFDSISPVIYNPEGFHGHEDAAMTQASQDLRVLAACRLTPTEVKHLRLLYDCTDLKSAHTALLCGVDDLEGHLFMGVRDKKSDVESKDLSVEEMSRWLEEVGFEAYLRNGLYQTRRAPMQTSADLS